MFVELISPEGPLYTDEAESITIPGGDGEITVLRYHLPMMSTLQPGTVIIRRGTEEFYFAVTRGVIQVTPLTLRILADTADRVEGLEEAAIEEARKTAEGLLKDRRSADSEAFAEASAQLERTMAMLRSVRRHRARRSPR